MLINIDEVANLALANALAVAGRRRPEGAEEPQAVLSA